MKWFVCHNNIIYTGCTFLVLPYLSTFYNKRHFLETGVYTPAFGLELGWLKWKWVFAVQHGY